MPRPASLLGGMRAASAATTTTTVATTIAPTFYPGTADQAAAQPVTVTAGDTTPGISFMMQSAPAFRVSGIVVDDSGNPVGGAIVMIMGDPRSGMFMGPAGNAQTQDNGRFVIGDVAPGAYRVMASVPMVSGGSGGASFSSWSSSSGGVGAASSGVVGGVSGGVAVSVDGPGGFGGVVNGGNSQMAPPIEVTDADVKGLRLAVRR